MVFAALVVVRLIHHLIKIKKFTSQSPGLFGYIAWLEII